MPITLLTTFSARNAVDRIIGKMGNEYDGFVTACQLNAQQARNEEYKLYLDGYGYDDIQMMKIKYQVLKRLKQEQSQSKGM